MDELTPEQKFAADDPEKMVPRQLMKGRRPEEIIAELIRLDWSRQAAEALVMRVWDDLRRYYGSPESRRELVAEAKRQVFVGAATILIAVCVTLVTLLGALGGAIPFVVVASGAFFVGVILLARGWTRWRLYRTDTFLFDQPTSACPDDETNRD